MNFVALRENIVLKPRLLEC